MESVKEVIDIVEALNERAVDRVGNAMFSVTVEYCVCSVDLMGMHLWDGEDDPREAIPCPDCHGEGRYQGKTCETCQGEGEVRESLLVWLPREACRMALEIVRAMEPRERDRMVDEVAQDPRLARWFRRNGNNGSDDDPS